MKENSYHLAYHLFKSLRNSIPQTQLIDYGLPQPISFSKRKILLLSIKLAEYLRKNCHSLRVGIVLPPGIGGTVANLAVLFSGKIPVNLNFSLGSNIARQLIKKAEIETLITAEKMIEKFPEFPWTDHTIEISSWFKKLAKAPYKLLMDAFLLSLPIKFSRYF